MEISVEASQSEASPLGRLVEEHRQYSQKLEAMLAQPYLSDTEQIGGIRAYLSIDVAGRGKCAR